MTKMKKKVSLSLVLIFIFTLAFPTWAFELNVDPDKTSYQGGESITVSTGAYGDTAGFSWSITDWNANKTPLAGDRNSITFNLPENNTGARVTAVIEAVYGSVVDGVYGNIGSINIDIEPGDPEPLQVVEIYPANGATGVPLDTEIYIKFNKPVEFENKVPFIPNDIQVGTPGYPLTPNEDSTKWSLASGSVSLEMEKEYEVIKHPLTTIKDKNSGQTFDSFPEWKFDTNPAVANSIRVDNVKAHVGIGEKLQLSAAVLAVSGMALADTVTWSSGNTNIADISPDGLLTGIDNGLAEITARANNNPDIIKEFQVGIGTETAPLQIINLCPADGESAAALYNSEKYIEFNKPAVFENAIPLPFNIQIDSKPHTLTPAEGGRKWSLPAGNPVLEKGETYTVSLPTFTSIKDAGDGSILGTFPDWSFTTQDVGIVIPAIIEITDYPERLNVGESYPLKAMVIKEFVCPPPAICV